ncbi:hypothetical protein KFE25_009098 [Diacronema lutheri]|uniref:Uncharacterized protein n=1 Tax=Diacronema lutheri TaxID=2081491 RepID=A0A8J6CD74_DIALT|nr:hypothetical protein KFE25_009098 [Diacronema lutheri]
MGTEGEVLAVGSLYAITGPYTERTFSVQPAGGLIGRSRKCPVSLLHDCEVSHNHAMVEPHAHSLSGFCIRDIGSTFGTYLNDKRLSDPKRASEPYKLKPGDTVKVGQTTLRWQPRHHLDAAASVLRIPPPPHSRDALGRPAGAPCGDDELAKVADVLDRAHRALCNKAAAVELAVVARRLEQLLRVQAQVDAAPAGMGADRDEWRALLRAECDALRKDVGLLIGQQRECVHKLLTAQSQVWFELRHATQELLTLGGAPPLRAAAVQWLRDANHHARWGYHVARLAQLWLDALEGTTYALVPSEAASAALQQRWRMLDGDARVQLGTLTDALGARPVDAREAHDARERLAISEFQLHALRMAHPTLAFDDGPAAVKPRAALALDGGALRGVCGAEAMAVVLPWSLGCYVLCPPPPPPARALAGGEHGCLGREALFDGAPCILQPCRRPAAELGDLRLRLVALAIQQAAGAAGTQHLPRIEALWIEPDGALWVHLASARADGAPTARCAPPSAGGGGALGGIGGARAFVRSEGGESGNSFVSQLSANWRRAFVELAVGLSVLHRAGLCAAGITADDLALDGDGRVLLLSLGLAQLGSDERPASEGSWRWAAIPPEGHDAGGVAPATWSSDLWGVGVLLWRAHFGDDLRALQAFLKANRAERPACVPQPERADGQLAAILAQLLHVNPHMRMPACALASHALLQAPLPTARAASLPDGAAALLSADEDAAHVIAAISHARASLADVRARARAAADARGRPSAAIVCEPTLCADMLSAVDALSDLELLGPLDLRLARAAGGTHSEGADGAEGATASSAAAAAAAVPLSVEELMTRFWARLFGAHSDGRLADTDATAAKLFDRELCQPLGVGKRHVSGALADAAATGRSAGTTATGAPGAAASASGATVAAGGGQLHPGSFVPRADAPEALLEALGRLLFKCVLDSLPLPLDALPAYWWRAAVGLGGACGLAELEPLSPLLSLQYHALLASGTTDGWMLDFEQLGMAPADVPQSLKLQWVTAKVHLELSSSRAKALEALRRGFARAAAAGAREPSASQPLQSLPAEALMLLAAGGISPPAAQLRAALRFCDFPPDSQAEQFVRALVDLMPGIQLRRFILLLTGFVELPTVRADGTPTCITVRCWPGAQDCAPIAHRCALTLDLPDYKSFDKLKQMLCRTLDDMPEAMPMNVVYDGDP